LTGEDALRAAASTIGQMSEADIRSKFAQLQAARTARTDREILRQQAEADSVELDEAAYEAAVRHEEAGDLESAVRWYRAAAVNDFPGASLRLAMALDVLAAEHYAKAETALGEALSEESRDSAAKAFAAGEVGASEFIDELDARLDPARAAAPPPANPEPAECALGGLQNVTRFESAMMLEHCHSCRSCQAELAVLAKLANTILR
jgi:tetratricopeptide (TPR) repeat protein